MSKSQVSLVRCESYAEDEVYQAVKKGIDLLGGISRFVRPGERIVLKPNVLIGSNPDRCVTTHPAVFKAAGRLAAEAGATVSYGDSPAIGRTELNLKWSGLKDAGDELGYDIADFDSGRDVRHTDGLLIKRFIIANGVLDADGLISLPKFKTHGLVRFTGAVKNQFGCIPGLLKGQFHARLPDPFDFATMLVDINTLVKPRLYIMDGIEAMEGNGPRGGKVRKMNVLLLSADPIALDATACRMIDLDPEIVPTAAPGEKSGLGTWRSENIELLGDPINTFIDTGFDVDRTPVTPVSGGWFMNLLKNRITPRPVIDTSRCTTCGTCVRMCPVEPQAVNWKNDDASRPPVYNYSRCIRCFCCQEMCPEGAISIHSPLLARIMGKI
ncbi:MAG: DUF362 domain-containing protein [Dehalococcoidales bacterium]|nr:DUF362 domain-containing protein [Dehalococcoidales bacterium]